MSTSTDKYIEQQFEAGRKSITPWIAFGEVLATIEKAAALPGFRYQLVAFDGGTRLQDWCDDDVVEEAKKKPPAQTEGRPHDPELSTLPDFRRVASRMAMIFWRVKALPVHTIFTARQRFLETEASTKEHRIYDAHANFYPKTLDEFEGCWDILARMSAQQSGLSEKFVFETRLSVRFVAKSRAKGLAPSIEDPSAKKVFSQLWGGESEP